MLCVDLDHAGLHLVLRAAIGPVHELLVLRRRLRRRRDHRVDRVLGDKVPAVAHRRRHVVRQLRHRRVVGLAPRHLAYERG